MKGEEVSGNSAAEPSYQFRNGGKGKRKKECLEVQHKVRPITMVMVHIAGRTHGGRSACREGKGFAYGQSTSRYF